ncbi:CPBP family intramembrane glutamic endopeptidase [Halanaerobium sp. ST460_2HS_T2]|jgi:membrane protease YdiL (CAAX protease family)|uniref:CPBP family intramembrane glutamic endopeptidase n=1 Tax=Halanaerobium sp. ST460_2HS_T2 TaxID=2183914 RepID=UPI000DF3E69C|nr:type II CAAX endopeptidase family protein [Halanaerobium sp. ST460_2HS_T2]RCW51620.1 CAAX prenyl protease-like protein [Halanaerobium sp. ST460_2HS_T2]
MLFKFSYSKHKKIITFILLSYLISWLIWLPNLLGNYFNVNWKSSNLLHFMGGLGPLLGATISTSIYYKKRGLKNYFKSRFFKLSALRWILVGLFLPFIFFIIAFLIVGMISGQWSDFNLIGTNSKIPFENKFLIWLIWILFFGIGEESGWRGFLFPELMKIYKPKSAAIYTAFIWVFWHLPLFLYDQDFKCMGLGGLAGWFIGLLFGALILAWLTYKAAFSLWPAILWHGTFNFFTAGDQISFLYPALITMMVIIYGFLISKNFKEGEEKWNPQK